MKKILLFLLLIPSVSFASPPTRVSTYTSGSVISASEVTANEDAIFNYLQSGVDTIKDGTIVNADINGSANIQSDKLNLTAVAQNINNTGTFSNTGAVTLTGAVGITGTTTVTGTLNATTIQQGGSSLIPQGVIVMWSGTIANIPSGWELSDGTCSITCPDLTNRFIVGADVDDGGIAKSTITGSALKSNDTGIYPAHTHTVGGGQNYNSSANISGTGPNSTDYTFTTSSSGTGTKVIPVFYALAYIIKI